MLKFKTKHERNSIKLTTLVVIIVALLLFVVGPDYLETPEEYGVAINFGEGSMLPNDYDNNTPFSNENIEEASNEVEDLIEDIENIEENIEDIEEEITDNEVVDEKPVEDEPTEEDIAKEEQAKQQAEQELLEQQEAEAERLKAEAIAKQKASEAKKKAAKAKADREAKAKAARQARAKAAAEKRARAAKAAAAKAEANRKAATAKAAQASKKNSSGGKNSGFVKSQEIPTYPGCEGLDNAARKNCLNKKIRSFISQNFNLNIFEDLGLKGNQKIKIGFTVDITGKVVGIRAIAAHPKIISETKRVMNSIPKLKPATNQGKPKKYPSSISITIQIKD